MKEYITPYMEITYFDTEDVITTSNPFNGDGTGSDIIVDP